MSLFQSSKSLLIGGLCIAVACASLMISCTGGPDHTPSQIVQKWLSLYPKDLAQAATITSWGMRDGLSAEKWIDRIKMTMGEFQYIDGQVVTEEITKDKATVIVDASITSVLGEQVQREQFKLSIVENHWVIDDRSVVMVLPSIPDFS